MFNYIKGSFSKLLSFATIRDISKQKHVTLIYTRTNLKSLYKEEEKEENAKMDLGKCLMKGLRTYVYVAFAILLFIRAVVITVSLVYGSIFFLNELHQLPNLIFLFSFL